MRHTTILELGYYRVADSYTELMNVVDLPNDQLPSHSINFFWLLLVSCCIMTITYVLAILNFFVMVTLRKEKEIKALSFILSIVIYIGSCLIIISGTCIRGTFINTSN